MDNQEKIVNHLRLIFKDKFSINIQGDFGVEITDDYIGDKFINITELDDNATYEDWCYDDFTIENVTLWANTIDDSELELDDSIQAEYKQIRRLLLEGINTFDMSTIDYKQNPTQVHVDEDMVLWRDVWEMFEKRDYYTRYDDKIEMLNELKKKFNITKKD